MRLQYIRTCRLLRLLWLLLLLLLLLAVGCSRRTTGSNSRPRQGEAALRELHAQARGEVTIRDALKELEVWGAETEFSLAEHASGISLIKDWKDVMTSVGDNQSLLLKNFADGADQRDQPDLPNQRIFWRQNSKRFGRSGWSRLTRCCSSSC